MFSPRDPVCKQLTTRGNIRVLHLQPAWAVESPTYFTPAMFIPFPLQHDLDDSPEAPLVDVVRTGSCSSSAASALCSTGSASRIMQSKAWIARPDTRREIEGAERIEQVRRWMTWRWAAAKPLELRHEASAALRSPLLRDVPRALRGKAGTRDTQRGDTLFDPFCGRGTTAFESLLNGRPAAITDVNPVAACVADAKADPPKLKSALARLDELEAVSSD